MRRMEMRLAENIRMHRKQLSLTREQFAETLGVTAGAVYKWEAGLSVPELDLIVEMADFFEVSVDALLGYQMKDNRMNAVVERLWKAGGSRDHAALSEAEKAVRKYPHSFDVVYAAAFLYYAFGTETRKEPWLRRAIELLDSARLLLPQCTDSRLSESLLCGRIAEMHELLGETDRALELLKAHNAGGQFDELIGITLLSHRKNPEEANAYLEQGLLQAVSSLIRGAIGYAMLFDRKDDSASGLEMMRWIIPALEGLKKTGEPNYLDKMIAVFHACLAIFQFKSGDREGAAASLGEAGTIARAFDAAPSYEANRLKYVRRSEMNSAHDALGETALDAVAYVLHDKEPALRELWAEVCSREEAPEPARHRVPLRPEEAPGDPPANPCRAGIADAAAVAALACELWPEHSVEEMEEEFGSLLAREDAAVFLYRERGEAVAFAQCQLRHDYVEGTESSPVGYLEGICVRESARRQGVARRLLAACEDWAREKGCAEFASDCEVDNTDSQRFHRAVGFEEANRIVAYVKRL